MSASKTALVLGGGGMFGAYQAGVWSVLASRWQPDLIIGASIGAINGWAMAGGCDPAEWIEQWLDLKEAESPQWRFPWPPHRGMVDAERFEGFVRRIHARYQPRTPYALTVTSMPGMRPRVFAAPSIDWRHLAASCAVPVVMPQYALDGQWYSDGGLLGSVPLWAAAELGADVAIGINILPHGPRWLRPVQASLRAIGRHRHTPRPGLQALIIEHPQRLGSTTDSFRWTREKALRQVQLGTEDALQAWPSMERLLKQSHPQTF